MVLHNVGCIYSLLGKLDEATYEHDSNLDPSRATPRFQKLLATL